MKTELTEEDIIKINSECPYNQGVFFEPYGIPVGIKEKVIYGRYETGGYRGGSCWDNSNPQPYYEEPPKDRMKVLDLVLAELCPNITYLQFKKIEEIIHDNFKSEWEYYGNSTDWKIEYIKLSDLYALITALNK